MTKKILSAILVLAVIAGVLGFGLPWYRQRQQAALPPPIETATAELRGIEQIVRASGEVVSAQATDIKSEVSGRIDRLAVKMGDKVKAGDVLVELNASDLKSEQEELNLALSASAIRREKMNLDFDRKKKLRDQSFVADKDLQDSNIDLRLADNEIETSRARLNTIAEKLQKAVIKAPHDGTVLNVKVRNGVVVTGAESAGELALLMQIADLKQLEVQTAIAEVDVTKVNLGMAATVTFDSLPGVTVAGKVTSVSLSAMPADKDKTIRVFPMVVALDPTDSPVRPGITGQVAIVTAAKPQALAIPTGAVFFDGAATVVFVEKDGKFEKRPVTLGITDHIAVEILNGLAAGEKVALQRPAGFAAK